MAKLHYHEFKVQGSWAFPLDMLRYDQCFPATQVDVEAIADKRNCPPVTLIHCGRKNWTPTVARWQSFGWSLAGHTRSWSVD